ncbi:restriction endonuclease subunit S [uncultured Methanobrevibacter sp.]|uniref:restriction endonuclease subunit S n=1 Tax=uncultured Methanobrevibacter sp. TaxID=253161 RepID=UPI003207D5FF
MNAQDLKNSILQLAMQGKLVPQDPNDEPASIFLNQIKKEKNRLIKDKKLKRNNKESSIYKNDGHIYEKVGKKGDEVCIDDEVPFDIPDNWEWVRINTIREVYTGNSINKTEKETKFTGLAEGYNYIATKDVNFDSSIEYENGVKIPKGLEKFRIAHSGSVLLCIEGGSAGRKIGILDEDVCFGNKLACFKTFKGDNKFLFYYLQSPNFKEIFKSKTTGIIGGVGIAKLRNVLMPIPPLNEQKRIVDKIEEFLPLIEEYGVNKEKLDKINSELPAKLKSSILQEAVQGKLVPQDSADEPASVLLKNIKQEKEQLIKAKKIKKNNKESVIFKEKGHYYEQIGKKEPICIDEDLPFEIPDSWEWVRLGSISFITKLAGFEYSKYISPNVQSDGIPLLKAKNIKNDCLIGNFDSYISKDLSDQLIRSKVNKKCVLTPYVGASIGNAVIFDNSFEAHLAPNLAKIELYGGIMEEYLFRYIKSPEGYKELTKYLKSTAQPSISMKALRDMLIPLPSLNEQKRIVDKVEQLFENIDVLVDG